MNRRSFFVAGGMLGGAVVTSLGSMDLDVNFDSVRELWSDVLRDADGAGLQATRVSDAEEIQLGNQFAQSVNSWVPMDAGWQPYVDAVGQKVAMGRQRKGIPYQFRVIDEPIQNAFALPGGHVFIYRGMLEFLNSEAELAAILGHEISHVDLRHCVERYQYSLKLKRIGVEGIGQIADFTRTLVSLGYGQFQELDADRNGLALSVRADYDPGAGAAVFRRMYLDVLAKQYSSVRPPNTPLEELARATVGAVSDYFRSHPSSATRMNNLQGARFMSARGI
jgi:beta-barrel assembly-enhancing protease